MYRGTTPNITLNVHTTLDMSNIKQCYVTLESKSNAKEITYEIDDLIIDSEEKTISLIMTQEDTLSFGSGDINVQIRFLMDDDKAYASNIKTTTMHQILKDGVIHEGV